MAELVWRQALDEFILELKKENSKEIYSLILYGSRARGDAEESSDIDLLLVLNNSVEISKYEHLVDKIASEVSLKYDLVISLIYLHRNRFEKRSEPLLINIRKEGKKVA